MSNNTTNSSCACVVHPNFNEKATRLEDIWHPYILLYVGHCAAALIFTFLSLKAPKCTIVLMILSGLSFLISAITGMPMWGHERFSFLWTGVFIKWAIVNASATVPVLILRAWKLDTRAVNALGIFVYFILGANVIWTLFMESKGHILVYINRVSGVMLTIALTAHCCAVRKAGLGLFEVRQGFPYGMGTSLPWLVCYTVWNALFIAKITIGGLLQDILFWVMMIAYAYIDDKHLPIELYFGFARPVQLGTYIGFTEFVGTFIPFFYEAPELTETHPLHINGHAFFLFIALMNMVWSFVCTFWAFQRLFFGLGFFQSRFDEVHNITRDQESDYDKYDEEDEDEDYE